MGTYFRKSEATLLAQQQLRQREQLRLERLRAAAQIEAMTGPRRVADQHGGAERGILGVGGRMVRYPGPVGDPGERAMRAGLATGLAAAGPARRAPLGMDDPALAAAEGTTAYLGQNLTRSEQVRRQYQAEAKQLEPLSGRVRKEDARRSALKVLYREILPAPQRYMTAAARPGTGPRPGSGGTANRSSTGWNAAGRVAGFAGRASIAGSAGMGAVEIVRSDNRPRTAAGVAGSTAGGTLAGVGGAELGGALGYEYGGVPGALLGSIVGGLLFSSAGGAAGREAATQGYDRATGPQAPPAPRPARQR